MQKETAFALRSGRRDAIMEAPDFTGPAFCAASSFFAPHLPNIHQDTRNHEFFKQCRRFSRQCKTISAGKTGF
jgi:hypothetical protein